jgi:hypothetical protein
MIYVKQMPVNPYVVFVGQSKTSIHPSDIK